jgi:hypothetical protein
VTTVSHLFPGLTYADCRAELDRELAQRRRVYPDRVAKMRMTQAEADYQIAIFTAIRDDTLRMERSFTDHPEPVEGQRSTHNFSWADRRRAIERELDYRTRFYPQWIANHRLTQEKADRQMAALKAVLWRYDMGFDWHPSNGVPCSWGSISIEADVEASRTEWRTHYAGIIGRWYEQPEAQAALL